MIKEGREGPASPREELGLVSCSVLTPGVWRTHSPAMGIPWMLSAPQWRLQAAHEQSHCADQSSSTTFQKYLLRDFLVFCVLPALGGLLLRARAALTKKEDELAFPPSPVNIYSPRQAVKMLLLSWFWCLFLLPRWNLAPESPTLADFVCAAVARGCS